MDTKTIVLIVVMVICVIVYLGPIYGAMYIETQDRKKRGELSPGKALYDERQTIIRLRAGVHALFALGGYLILWAALDLFGGQKGGWAWTGEVAPLVSVGVVLAAEVWTVECTLRDAAVGWNQKNGAAGQVSISTIYLFCCMIWGYVFQEDGKFVLGCVMYLTAVGLAVIDLVTLYAKHRRKKRPDQEDE
ncbi:MAG: hypothetical protein K2M42_04765 [Oscillospiraceae bacterium]|nr:hypothetical protein [Oscillospiraceae bacterium]